MQQSCHGKVHVLNSRPEGSDLLKIMIFSTFSSFDGLSRVASGAIVSTASSPPPPDFDVVMTEELVFPLSEDDPEALMVQVLAVGEIGREASEVLDTGSIAGDDLGVGSEPRISDAMLHSNASLKWSTASKGAILQSMMIVETRISGG